MNRRRRRKRIGVGRIVLIAALIIAVVVVAKVAHGASVNRANDASPNSGPADVSEELQAETGAGVVGIRPGAQTAAGPEDGREDGQVFLRPAPQETQEETGSEWPDEPGLAVGPAETEPPAPAIDPSQPMVALTFDDGPSATLTPRLLDILRDNGVHATFFVVGYNLDGNEAILQRAVAEGHEIGNHTMNHPHLRSLGSAELDQEIGAMRQRIVDITGQQVVPIRPPYGETNDTVDAHITDPVILWSVDSRDWADRDVGMACDHIYNDTFDGCIILMHDIHPETVDAAAIFIPWLKEQGYQLVTVSELGQYRSGGLNAGEHYFSIAAPETEAAEMAPAETAA